MTSVMLYVKVKCDPCNEFTHFYFIKISPLKFIEFLFFIQQCSVKFFLLYIQTLLLSSWFPGYAWTITECLGCWSHIGWKFTATQV